MSTATPESRLEYLEDLIPKMRQELEKQGRLIEILNEALRKHIVSGRSEQFKCSCGSTDFDKNNYNDSIRCNGCGSVYTNI